MDDIRYFGSDLPRLKALRAGRGWSVRRLAKEAGLSPTTVNEIELGKRRAKDDTVVKLTEALDVERVDLIFPPEQVRYWKGQDELDNEILAQQLASLTDRELEVILLDSPLLRRRVMDMVRREGTSETAPEK